ncbi:type II toxin-antitoxin system HicB family antitoxin [Crocosphaera sp.]|uniref:type II toxin-antitoxin system HicB family antitoxin n=1 Tax=Crocosphaera sp. TaxID=2729996 RepID=UPI00260E55ED|nr:type II toxin-antitoxin system HicB family antitoxin [Crocosphaera sp.]MDJ0579490.1 type II toxin-antitoxin system HicB family antitoxin [Crocosphaera sp.]
MKSRYSIVIQWSDEDQCYIVSLPEFGKYARTHGDTYEEAVKNAQDVLELLIEDNKNLPQPNIYQSFAAKSS